jgi:hypothetical protein
VTSRPGPGRTSIASPAISTTKPTSATPAR